MNVEELVRDSFREQAADGALAPPGFADRVLAVRRRRRTRTIAGAAVATAAAVAVATAVPLLDTGGDDVRPASRMNRSDIIAHPDQSPPRDLIAAGDTAVAAFSTTKQVKQPNKDKIITRTYSLLDQKTGKYVKDSRWSFVDVAPGMLTAAVLEPELPAKRVGLLNLMTGKVDRWIPVGQGVAGVHFSPDGKKLVATTYAKNPDRLYWSKRIPVNDTVEPQSVPSRTGFTVIDVASGKGDWHKAPYWKDELGWSPNSRADFAFNHDGKLLYEQIAMAPGRIYHDLQGKKVPTPADEKHLGWTDAGLSPDGKLVGGGFAGKGKEIASEIIDPLTGKRITKVPGQMLLAWADNKRIIAWGIIPGTNEFKQQLVLVTIGSDKIVPLSDFRTPKDNTAGRWEPLFSTR
ncbi:WD40 repeat domain-containing protein [Streptomyces sp. NBC_01236]|uniref:WD40 repeat domain-containing protein n=1 Tax=Streptomyces sp. NBC_01236 TaxID=2903789 RepID=UPI002E0EFCB7|nr:WD40 repeat domain-containing protein [Streptomyces sp. NBC_01236]